MMSDRRGRSEAIPIHRGAVAFALKQQELGTSVEKICRKMGISYATFYSTTDH